MFYFLTLPTYAAFTNTKNQCALTCSNSKFKFKMFNKYKPF